MITCQNAAFGKDSYYVENPRLSAAFNQNQVSQLPISKRRLEKHQTLTNPRVMQFALRFEF